MRLIIITSLFVLNVSGNAHAQLGLVSEKQELAAGKQADQQIMKKYRVSADTELNGLVSHLGKRLVKVCDRPNLEWTFRVLDSKELNAFSVPGYVYVTTETIATVKDDQDALAGVIGHEIGHTCGKHAKKQMEKGAVSGLLVTIIGAKNRDISQLAGVASGLVMLGYSRDDENDADKRAVRYTMRAGYDPNGLIRFFEILQKKGDKGGGGVEAYFRTHPPTADRIKRVKANIAKEAEAMDKPEEENAKRRPPR